MYMVLGGQGSHHVHSFNPHSRGRTGAVTGTFKMADAVPPKLSFADYLTGPRY